MRSGKFIRKLRQKEGLLLRQLASHIEIDQALLSKIERGERFATEEQIQSITRFFQIENEQLQILWLSEKICDLLKEHQSIANEVLVTTKQKILNQNGYKVEK